MKRQIFDLMPRYDSLVSRHALKHIELLLPLCRGMSSMCHGMLLSGILVNDLYVATCTTCVAACHLLLAQNRLHNPTHSSYMIASISKKLIIAFVDIQIQLLIHFFSCLNGLELTLFSLCLNYLEDTYLKHFCPFSNISFSLFYQGMRLINSILISHRCLAKKNSLIL